VFLLVLAHPGSPEQRAVKWLLLLLLLLFSPVHCLAEHDEIWHHKGHLCIAGHLLFWCTLVHFFGNTNFRQLISRTLFVRARRKLTG